MHRLHRGGGCLKLRRAGLCDFDPWKSIHGSDLAHLPGVWNPTMRVAYLRSVKYSNFMSVILMIVFQHCSAVG